jgi:hypothetical protein
MDRAKAIKNDLVTVVFHPDRVEKWLEEGGHALMEAMFDF